MHQWLGDLSCSKQYTGKSETQLNIRFNNNRNHLNTVLTNCKLVQHYHQSKTCNFENDLIITPIERLRIADNKNIIKERKKFYWNEKNSGNPVDIRRPKTSIRRPKTSKDVHRTLKDVQTRPIDVFGRLMFTGKTH